MARVASLHVFPVKSMAGFAPERAMVRRSGLEDDRRWMLVTPDGMFLTQRSVPLLARLAPRADANGLILSIPGHGEIEAAPRSETVEVTIWRDTLRAETCAPEVDDFLSQAIGAPCRLVYLGDLGRRPLHPSYRSAQETVTFADGFPLLLTGTASLDDLNSRLATPVRMNRFRPNLVVEGAPAWAEDCWRLIRIGPVRFRIAKPCDRCITTTVEQETGRRPDKSEPLRTLGRFRRTAEGVMFGQNLVPLDEGMISVGMQVEILDAGEPNLAIVAAA